MIVDFNELYEKIINYYLAVEDYSYLNDPTLTYQECVLIEEVCRIDQVNGDLAGYQDLITTFDYDKLSIRDYMDYGSLWDHCIAKLFHPIEITRPWTDVLVDKRITKPNIPRNFEKGKSWKNLPPFDVIREDEKRISQALYKDYRIRVSAKVPDYTVCGEVYEIKS